MFLTRCFNIAFISVCLLPLSSAQMSAQMPQINIVLGMTYDSEIRSDVRTFGLWYDSSHSSTDPNLPIAVYIHGGGWSGGSAYPPLGQPGTLTSGVCNDTNTVVCYLANIGYAVYSINYTLAASGEDTKWPAQWQDCECFFKFLAEEAGVTVPGDPQQIFLFGHSAGAHLAAVTALAPHDAFSPDCSHTSLSYSVKAVGLASAPIDLQQLFTESGVPGTEGAIANLLGCDPGLGAPPDCLALAASANPASYVAQGQPPVQVESGYSDKEIPYQFQGALHSAYAALLPPVSSPWIIYGQDGPPPYNHNLDLFYYNPCSLGTEPSPCGSAGEAFEDMLSFFEGSSPKR
jgi:acetyl esterase/lipase